MSLVRLALLLFLLLIVGGTAVAQTTVTLQEGLNGYTGSADAWIWSDEPDDNTDLTTWNLRGTSNAVVLRVPIFQAEGGPVPDGAAITSATLSIYKFSGPDGVFKAERLLRAWQETQVTWNNATISAPWATPGALGSTDVSTTDAATGSIGNDTGWVSFDVTTAVQAVAAGAGDYGWRLQQTGGTQLPHDFIARNHSNQMLRPKLTLTYNPPGPSCSGGSLRPYDGAPINGNPIGIAASGSSTFEAEHFNCGGADVAYHDNTTANTGNAGLRTGEGVDIATSDEGPVLKNFETGEWVSYTINVAAGGVYDLSIRASNNLSPASFRIELNGIDVTGDVSVPVTGSWQSFDWFTKPSVSLPTGEHVLKVVSTRQYFDVSQIRATFVSAETCNSGSLRPYGESPINGNPITVGTGTTTFEAEYFNCGGQGVAYNDAGPGNVGDAGIRTGESVDIRNSAAGPVVYNFQTSEWLTYAINVAQGGTYAIEINASNADSPAGFHVEIGTAALPNIAVPVTGGWSTFGWYGYPTVNLSPGQHTLKLVSDQQYFDVNQIRIVHVGTSACGSGALRPYDGLPVSGTPTEIPAAGATFEAEHFDCGGAGTAYQDTETANLEGALRPDEGVDIAPALSTGNHVVKHFRTGEWMKYTVNIQTAGTYDISVLASSNWTQATPKVSINVDGQDVTPSGGLAVFTGNWDQYSWITQPGVTLTAGSHVITVTSAQEYLNVDRLRIAPPGPVNPQPGDLIFRTGFEGSQTVIEFGGKPGDPQENGNNACWGSGCWQRIVGDEWPPRVDPNSHGKFQARTGGGSPTPQTLDTWIVNMIQSGGGRSGRGLYSEVKGSAGSFAQDPYLIIPATDIEQLYISFWVKLEETHNDLVTQLGNYNTERVVFELKAGSLGGGDDGDYRVIVAVYHDDIDNKPIWRVYADDRAGGGTNPHTTFWDIFNVAPPRPQDYTHVPVAGGQWTKLEFFWRRSSIAQQARIWVGINGTKIADCPDPNEPKDPINRIFLSQIYSNSNVYPMRQWQDDIQIWGSFPPAPGQNDEWSDAPYAPHDNPNTAAC